MDIQFDQLRTFAAVIDHGSFDAAARELRVTASAVSQRIKALENGVGRVLLTRTKPAKPTVSGEVLLRLARQISVAETDALGALGSDDSSTGTTSTMPIVVNADSLETWVLPALAGIPPSLGVCFDLYREDEHHSTGLLRDGTVVAAVTAEAQAVQGCTVTPLGSMRYRPMASPGFRTEWFPRGSTVSSLAIAPVVLFDRKDVLQHRYIAERTKRALHPPRHFVPASSGFADAIRLGLGWGLLPDAQSAHLECTGELVNIDPGAHVDMPLYWQQWSLHSPLVAAVAHAIAAAATVHLERRTDRSKRGN
jgi:LysR family transcriptional regulator (chromosome initiation inhibitor)